MQHCKACNMALSSTSNLNSCGFWLQIITIGDCTKAETLIYFRERVLPRVPERLHVALHFEELFEAFGGKLAHWHDYITDYGALVLHCLSESILTKYVSCVFSER